MPQLGQGTNGSIPAGGCTEWATVLGEDASGGYGAAKAMDAGDGPSIFLPWRFTAEELAAADMALGGGGTSGGGVEQT